MSGWDVSNVEDMTQFLHVNHADGGVFNVDLSEWDVGKVTHAQNMFRNQPRFKQCLSGSAWVAMSSNAGVDKANMFFKTVAGAIGPTCLDTRVCPAGHYCSDTSCILWAACEASIRIHSDQCMKSDTTRTLPASPWLLGEPMGRAEISDDTEIFVIDCDENTPDSVLVYCGIFVQYGTYSGRKTWKKLGRNGDDLSPYPNLYRHNANGWAFHLDGFDNGPSFNLGSGESPAITDISAWTSATDEFPPA